MKIAIIGAGNVGKALGAAFRAKGRTVIYGSRDPGKRTERTGKTVGQALIGAEAVTFVIARRQDVANRNAEPRVRVTDPIPKKRSSYGYPC